MITELEKTNRYYNAMKEIVDNIKEGRKANILSAGKRNKIHGRLSASLIEANIIRGASDRKFSGYVLLIDNATPMYAKRVMEINEKYIKAKHNKNNEKRRKKKKSKTTLTQGQEELKPKIDIVYSSIESRNINNQYGLENQEEIEARIKHITDMNIDLANKNIGLLTKNNSLISEIAECKKEPASEFLIKTHNKLVDDYMDLEQVNKELSDKIDVLEKDIEIRIEYNKSGYESKNKTIEHSKHIVEFNNRLKEENENLHNKISDLDDQNDILNKMLFAEPSDEDCINATKQQVDEVCNPKTYNYSVTPQEQSKQVGIIRQFFRWLY